MPKLVDPERIATYVRLRHELGLSQEKAGAEAGISEWKAMKIDKGYVGSVTKRVDDSEIVGAIPYENLSEVAKECLEDFEKFRLRYTGNVSTPWQLMAAKEAVAAKATVNKEYMVINCPPGSGKSTLFAHDLVLWLIVKDRTLRCLIGSRTERQATVYTARVKRSLERTSLVRAKDEDKKRGTAKDAKGILAVDFGRFKPITGEQWTRGQFSVEQIDGRPPADKEPTLAGFGEDSGQLGWRVDLIVWDDVVDKKVLRSMERVENQREWYDDEAETRLEPGGLLLLQGQRLAGHDLYRYALDKRMVGEEGEFTDERKYDSIKFKAHYTDRCVGQHDPAKAKPYPDGCLLDPYRLPWRELRTHMANNVRFEVVYQQEDMDPSNVLVKKVWVDGGKDIENGEESPGCWDRERGIAEVPNLAGQSYSIVTADPSPSKFWAIQWWIYHPATDQRFLMDLVRQKMDAPDLLDFNTTNHTFSGLMEDWWERSIDVGHRITHWVVENNAAQRFMLQYDFVKRWQGLRSVSVIPHGTYRNKSDEELGVSSIAPHYRYGRVRLPGRGDARLASLKLIDEVTRWPDAATDDCVMAHWFLEWNLPNIVMPDLDDIPTMAVPSWMGPSDDGNAWPAALGSIPVAGGSQ